MSVIDDIREMLGQFRAGVTELAEADRKQVAELQRLRITTARQADEIDEQRAIIARLTAELEKEREDHGRTIDQRDALHARIDEIADALGDETEWSNCNDRGARARELAAQLAKAPLRLRLLRAQLAAYAKMTETQRGQLERLTAELEKERGRHLDITELRAMLESRYKEQPGEMGDLLDALYTAIERTLPARPEIAQLGAERQKRYEVEQELTRVREELATLPGITAHVRTLLGILDAIGGYMPTDYQAAIRAAREAVGRGA